MLFHVNFVNNYMLLLLLMCYFMFPLLINVLLYVHVFFVDKCVVHVNIVNKCVILCLPYK